MIYIIIGFIIIIIAMGGIIYFQRKTINKIELQKIKEQQEIERMVRETNEKIKDIKNENTVDPNLDNVIDNINL